MKILSIAQFSLHNDSIDRFNLKGQQFRFHYLNTTLRRQRRKASAVSHNNVTVEMTEKDRIQREIPKPFHITGSCK